MSRRRVGALVVGLLVAIAACLAWPDAEPDDPPTETETQTTTRSTERPGPTNGARPPSTGDAEPPPERPSPVRCEVGRALDGRDCRLEVPVRRPDGTTMLAETPFVHDGSTIRFDALPVSVGHGVLFCAGIEAFWIDWSAVGCTFSTDLPPPADAPLRGKVRGAADLPDGTVFLEGCGARDDDPVDADGSFFLQTSAGRCRIRAWRQAGMLRLPGPWTDVDALSNVDVDVDLSVSTFAPAGMGVGFQPQEGGVGITGVRPGTPAEAAGLEAGDLILRIDGDPTLGMGLEDFLEAGVGPEGSEVRLEGTTAAGEAFDVTITRRPIRTE